MTTYNPAIHASVVCNLRQYWKEEEPTIELKLSDSEIWKVFEDNYFLDEPDREKYVEGIRIALRSKFERTYAQA